MTRHRLDALQRNAPIAALDLLAMVIIDTPLAICATEGVFRP